MDKNLYVEEIEVFSCEKCRRPAKFRAIKEGKIIYFCKAHLPAHFFTKTSIEPFVRLQNRGLFKTSSIIKTKGSFSIFHWKDFGYQRKTLRNGMSLREKIEWKALGEKLFCTAFIHFGDLVGEISYRGEKYIYYKDELFSEDYLVCTKLGTPLMWVDRNYKFVKPVTG